CLLKEGRVESINCNETESYPFWHTKKNFTNTTDLHHITVLRTGGSTHFLFFTIRYLIVTKCAGIVCRVFHMNAPARNIVNLTFVNVSFSLSVNEHPMLP